MSEWLARVLNRIFCGVTEAIIAVLSIIGIIAIIASQASGPTVLPARASLLTVALVAIGPATVNPAVDRDIAVAFTSQMPDSIRTVPSIVISELVVGGGSL